MNSLKNIIACLCILSLSCNAEIEASFFEQIEPIKKDLYKFSPHELYDYLNLSPIAIPIITADELKHALTPESDVLVVNVLTQNYHDDCHIKGSINAPLPELVDQAKSWDKSQKIIVYCALDACDAGEKGCILLHCMGFKNLADYRGGIKEWFQLGYPTVGPAESDYLHWKSVSMDEFKLYPGTIVCSRQTRWINKYQK